MTDSGNYKSGGDHVVSSRRLQRECKIPQCFELPQKHESIIYSLDDDDSCQKHEKMLKQSNESNLFLSVVTGIEQGESGI
jgi:hypothetical protein